VRWICRALIGFGLTLALCAPGTAAGSGSPLLRLERRGDEVTLTWAWADGQPLDGLAQQWPVAPDLALPFAAWLVALPAQALPQWEVEAISTEFHAGLALPQGEHDAIEPLPENWPLDVEEAGVMRGVRLARLRFFPARPEGQGWRIVTALRARLRLPAALGIGAQRSPTDDPLLRALAGQVLNPEAVRRAPAHVLTADAQASALPRVLLDVAVPGLVAITRAALLRTGFPVGSPHTLRLRQGDAEVLMLWEGDGDDAFEDGERLLFYAAPRFSRYADHDTWILEDTGAPQPRMGSRSAAPGALPIGALRTQRVFEQNAIYTPDCGCQPPQGRDGDRWAWVSLQRHQTWSYSLPITASGSATITLWLIGYTDPPQSPDHRAQAWLNGGLLGEVTWDGRQAITATFPAHLSASNTLSVTLPGLAGVTTEGMWVDALAIEFIAGADWQELPLRGETTQRAYVLTAPPLYLLDISTPTQPTNLIGWANEGSGIRVADPPGGLPRTYLATTTVRQPLRIRLPAPQNPAQGAFHIIAPADFMPALAGLVQRRQSQGITVVTQTAQAIYDHNGDGRMDPLAIRAYLSRRYYSDAQRPAYALLVGDGTLDPKRYRPSSPPTLLPALLADVDPRLGETASDNRLVTVDGLDALPDIAIGRWPANNAGEVSALVSKTLAYEDALLTAADRRALFVADDADLAGNFPARAQALAGLVPPGYLTVTALMTNALAFTATRALTLAQWNQARLIAYVGHASPRQWAVERLLHRDDVSVLRRGAALPVVIGLTCYTGRFQELQDTLDETLVRAADRGAVVAWGSTGLAVSAGHETLGAGFIPVWLNGGRVGDAALAGQLALAAGGVYLDLLDTYVLLGDPTLTPGQHWAAHTLYLPVGRLTSRD